MLHLFTPPEQNFHTHILNQCLSKLTLPMASAMDSTMPPTIPPSLAASFRVTMMSSTASFMSWAASEMASWVCDAWRQSQLINVAVIVSVPPEGNSSAWQQLQSVPTAGKCCVSYTHTSPGLITAWRTCSHATYRLWGIFSRGKKRREHADWFALKCTNRRTMYLLLKTHSCLHN